MGSTLSVYGTMSTIMNRGWEGAGPAPAPRGLRAAAGEGEGDLRRTTSDA
jgi:hypothetical protein